MEYETAPLYNLVDAEKYSTQRPILEKLLTKMIDEGVKCAEDRCSSRGTCVVDQYFFEKDYTNSDYTTIFTKDPCVCDVERQGTDCSEVYDAAAEANRESLDAKLVTWTKLPISMFSTEKYSGYNGEKTYDRTVINVSYPEWAIFPTVYYSSDWKNAVSRYGTYVVGGKSAELLDSGVIAKPETFQKLTRGSMYVYYPVCPKGYSKTSAYNQSGFDATRNKYATAYQDTSKYVHCLKDDYWIT